MSPATLKAPVSSGDHARGPADAAVTLVEYGDYECPHCARAHPLLQLVLGRLGDRVRFVFRNFPLTEIHPHAELAAEAAEAAGARGRFWEMHDMIYEHQREGLETEDLARYAGAVGLDAMAVMQDVASHAHLRRIREDFMSGVRSGVNGTPTFFINGTRFDGDWTDVDGFIEAISDAPVSA
jgi:protein-disulfide isomerase